MNETATSKIKSKLKSKVVFFLNLLLVYYELEYQKWIFTQQYISEDRELDTNSLICI